MSHEPGFRRSRPKNLSFAAVLKATERKPVSSEASTAAWDVDPSTPMGFHRVEEIIRAFKAEVQSTDTLDDYVKHRFLGRGSCGVVFKVRHCRTGHFYARKQVQLDANDLKPRTVVAALIALYKTDCPNLLKLDNFFYQESSIYLMLEYMNCRDLKVVMKKVGPYPERVLSLATKQMLIGLKYLHEVKGIVHRDIKPGNILLNDLGECKIADFGMAGFKKKEFDTFLGTMIYMSPERLQGQKHSFNSDCWSLGLTLAELAIGRFPFDWDERGSFFEMLETVEECISTRSMLRRAPPELAFSDQFVDFIHKCCVVDWHQRPSAAELLEHPFITMHDGSRPSFRSWLHRSYIRPRHAELRAQKKAHVEQPEQHGASSPFDAMNTNDTPRTPVVVPLRARAGEELVEEVVTEDVFGGEEVVTEDVFGGEEVVTEDVFGGEEAVTEDVFGQEEAGGEVAADVFGQEEGDGEVTDDVFG